MSEVISPLRSALLTGSFLAAGTALIPAPARAIGSTFTFQLGNSTATPATPLASASKSFTATADGSTLNLVFQNALQPNGIPKPVSATADGLCIYKAGGPASNCGLPDAGDGSGVGDQTSIDLFFDQQVELLSYQYGSLLVGSGNPMITWGEPSSPVVSTETLVTRQGFQVVPKNVNTTYTFTNPFIVNANKIITITGFRGGSGTHQAQLSQLVVRTVPQGPPPSSSVPGPLPLLGAGAAFGWSRRLRSRLKSTPYS